MAMVAFEVSHVEPGVRTGGGGGADAAFSPSHGGSPYEPASRAPQPQYGAPPAQGGAQAWPSAAAEAERPARRTPPAADGAPAPRVAPAAGRAAAEEAQWTEVYYHPELWYDNRAQVAGTRRPDFVLKSDSKQGLWLDSRNRPAWAAEYMGERNETPPRAWDPPQAAQQDDQPGQAPF